jgi:putative ABC transport system permease protein
MQRHVILLAMHLGGDFRYGARRLWKSPGFTVIALAALALGMGATTAIFSVVDTVLLKPLPFFEPDRLLAMWEMDPALHRDRNFVAPVNFLAWRQRSRTVEPMAAIHDVRANISGGAGEPEEVKVERVTASLFPLLGVQPVVGRAFSEQEDLAGHGTVAVIGYSLWQRRFGGDRTVTGKSLRVRDRVFNIVGVLPAGFAILEPGVDVWIPIELAPEDRSNNGRYLTVIGRMRPGATLAGVRQEMAAIGVESERTLPAVNLGWRPSIYSLQEELVFDVRRPLWVLLGACGLLLAMSCANVANLLLVRGSARRKEIAVRAALGASRGRLVTQLLSESLLLAVGGGLLGLLLAAAAVAVVARAGPTDVPRLAQASLNGRLFLFALAASIFSGILFGIAPAWHGSRGDLNAALNEGGRAGTSGRASRMVRQILVILEIALAVVVLIGAGLLMRSFVRLRAANPGFNPAGILTLRVPMGGGRNSAVERRVAFANAMVERISALPGVQSAGAVSALPLNGLSTGADFVVEGRPGPPPVRHPNGLVRSVTRDYFRTMAIPLVSGRVFNDSDNRQAKQVVIVNRTLARQFWPGGDPLGARLVIETTSTRTAEIVGVVADVKPDRFEGEDWPMIYSPYGQVSPSGLTLVIRGAGRPEALILPVSGEIRRLDPEQVIADVRPMTAVVDHAVAGARFNAALLAIFAAIAFVLASLGIYGVISFDVTERTNEIGIRMALGAMPGDVLRMVVGQGARLAAGGIVLGLAGAFWLTRLMGSMLYGISPADAGTYLSISIVLAVVALAASYLPSRRAMSLEPVSALRHE